MTAPTWDIIDGGEPGLPAIIVKVDDLLIEDSTITGGLTDDDPPYQVAFDGGPGVVATGHVAVFDTTITGGPGQDKDLDFTFGTPSSCDFLGGVGGIGVIALGTLYHANSVIQGGAGGAISGYIQGTPGTFPFCVADDGADTQVSGTVGFPGDTLLASGPFLENQGFSLTWDNGDQAFAYLLVSPLPMPPAQLGLGQYLFFDPAAMVLLPAVGPGLTTQSFSVPSDPALYGNTLAIQRYSADKGLSRPAFATYLPQ